MANPLFNEQMTRSLMPQFNSFMKNPMQFLMQRKINIPQQFSNDPHGAIEYMLNNGQMTQQQLNSLTQMVQKMGIKL